MSMLPVGLVNDLGLVSLFSLFSLFSFFSLFSLFLAIFLAEVVLGGLSLIDPDLAFVLDGTSLVESLFFGVVEIFFLLDLSLSAILDLDLDFVGVLIAFLSGVLLVCALRDFWLP